MKQAVREFCEAATYPPDEKVDLAAKYSGAMIDGYWDKLHAVAWRPATVADLDTRIVCGKGGQTYYGATWIYVPADTEFQAAFQSHPMTYLRWSVNGRALDPGAYKETPGSVHTVATHALALKSGWNELKFRGYCTGYPPFRAGLVLSAPQEKLWTVRLSPTPPETPGKP
jgi:hypothetical protein